MTTQSKETMESRLKKTGFYNFIGLTSRNGQREIKSFIRSELSLQHTKDLQEFEKIIGDLIVRYKQGKRKMHSETHKLRNRFPDKAERISEKVSKRSIQIDAGIKAFEKIRTALATLKEKE